MADYLILRDSVEQIAWNALTNTQRVNALREPTDPLYDRTSFKGKKFSVSFGGFHPVNEKIGNIERTLSGKADYQVGGVVYTGTFIIKTVGEIADEEIDKNFGTIDDVDWYFTRCSPSTNAAVASNLITLVDHFEKEWVGFLVGSHSPEPITTTIIGPYAYYNIQIQFVARDLVVRNTR